MFICQIYFYLIRANFAALGRTETAATCKLVNFENKKIPSFDRHGKSRFNRGHFRIVSSPTILLLFE